MFVREPTTATEHHLGVDTLSWGRCFCFPPAQPLGWNLRAGVSPGRFPARGRREMSGLGETSRPRWANVHNAALPPRWRRASQPCPDHWSIHFAAAPVRTGKVVAGLARDQPRPVATGRTMKPKCRHQQLRPLGVKIWRVRGVRGAQLPPRKSQALQPLVQRHQRQVASSSCCASADAGQSA